MSEFVVFVVILLIKCSCVSLYFCPLTVYYTYDFFYFEGVQMLFLRDRLDAICSKHVYRVHGMNLGDAVTIATTVWQINNQAGVVSILTKKKHCCAI